MSSFNGSLLWEPWEVLKNEYGGKLDTNSSWAKGHESLILHSDQTKDCYDIYICTDKSYHIHPHPQA